MTAAEVPAQSVLTHALALAQAGYLSFPLRPFSKIPATARGFKDASVDVEQLTRWFDNDLGRNLGVPCGPQPNGVCLFAVDVDPAHGGAETWGGLVEAHGEPLAPRHDTPSGGFHLFFDAPDLRSSVGRLGVGVDTRGEGGYVVVPPSVLVDGDGVVVRYRSSSRAALVLNRPGQRPDWVAELASVPVVPVRSLVSHPSFGGGSVFERARLGWDWQRELSADGWVAHSASGGDVRWTRPGKDPRSGHSATLHPSGAFVVFTQERPFGGKPTNGSDGASFSPGEYIQHYRLGGDFSALCRLFAVTTTADRGHLGAVAAGGSQPAPAMTVQGDHLPGVEQEYWSLSSRNAHVLQAARSRILSPDALDVAVWALQSCLVPPSWMVESPLGPQPLNMLSCLVGRTGDFKTATLGAALDLVRLPPWVAAIGMGSGEGIGAMFLKEEVVENEHGRREKTGRLVRNDLQAVFFEADEGSGLTAQAGRAGATIIANLCRAWSGSMLGEANADISKRRTVLRGDYRIAAAVNIQPSNFAGLFSVANTGTGLTGRFLFAPTVDADVPDVEPEWPGPFSFEPLPKMPVLITVDPTILEASKARLRARHREASLGGDTDRVGQNDAIVARIAALSAVFDGRRHVAEADWRLAGMRAEASSKLLKTLDSWSVELKSVARHTQAIARANEQLVIDDVKERRAVARLAEAIRDYGSYPRSRGKVERSLTSSSTRARFGAALALAVNNGWIIITGDTLNRV